MKKIDPHTQQPIIGKDGKQVTEEKDCLLYTSDVNEKVGTIAAEVGRTPQAWNANVFSMIRARCV